MKSKYITMLGDKEYDIDCESMDCDDIAFFLAYADRNGCFVMAEKLRYELARREGREIDDVCLEGHENRQKRI